MRQALIALTLAAVFIAIPAAAQPVVGLEIYREDDTFMSLVRGHGAGGGGPRLS